MPLDPMLELVRDAYGLAREDFWELPQKKGTWIIKHSALEIVAMKAEIDFAMPQILEANSAAGTAAVCVQGTMAVKDKGPQTTWSIGEASPKNCKNAYPWAMAEKRAKDRVILKLVGIHGLVYSEDEADDFKAPTNAPSGMTEPPPSEPVKQKSANASRDADKALRQEIEACSSVEELQGLWRSAAFQKEFKSMPDTWQDMMVEKFNEAIEDFKAKEKRVASDPRKQFDKMMEGQDV